MLVFDLCGIFADGRSWIEALLSSYNWFVFWAVLSWCKLLLTNVRYIVSSLPMKAEVSKVSPASCSLFPVVVHWFWFCGHRPVCPALSFAGVSGSQLQSNICLEGRTVQNSLCYWKGFYCILQSVFFWNEVSIVCFYKSLFWSLTIYLIKNTQRTFLFQLSCRQITITITVKKKQKLNNEQQRTQNCKLYNHDN